VGKKPVRATVCAASSDPSSSQGVSGEMETTGKIRQIENRENSLFTVGESLDVTMAHTLTSSSLP